MKHRYAAPVLTLLVLASLCYIFWFANDTENPRISASEPVTLTSKPKSSKKTKDTVKRQKQRKQILREYCLNHAHNKESERYDLSFVIVEETQKIVYCSIPKVASTTWKTVLAEGRGLQSGIFVHRWTLWRRLSQYTSQQQSSILKSYYKFLIVREPLKRLLSAYKDKFQGSNRLYTTRLRRNIVKRFRPKDFTNPHGDYNVSFAEFVRYLSTNVSRNQHWRQYDALCHPCAIRYDFIGHLETLNDDAAMILKNAGFADSITFPTIHASSDASEVKQFFAQVPAQYVRQLGEVYRSDFEMFGYEYLGPVKSLLNKSETKNTEPEVRERRTGHLFPG